MKRPIYSRLLIPIILFVAIGGGAFAQNPEKTWDYPIKPGSKEWLSQPEFIGKLTLLNIPSNTLKLLTTNQLVKVCLDYPYFSLVFTRNSLQQGYEFIRDNFNGFRELENRPDASQYLLVEYEKMDPSDFKPESSLGTKGEYMAKFTFIELLLAQFPILDNTDLSMKNQILNVGFQKYKKKLLIPSYGLVGLSTTAFVLGRTINSIDANSPNLNEEEIFKIQNFLNYCSAENVEFYNNVIIKQTESYIQNE